MKKFLCGAMLLLAAVAAFTSCKKDEGEKKIDSITLSPATIKLVPGTTQRIAVSPNNGTYTWTSSDEAVATVSTNGTVTAIKIGTATITCTEKGGATATCAVTVCSYLETLNFTEASALMPRVIDPTKKEWTGLVITATGDSVYGYLGRTTLKIYSEGLYEDTEGLTGTSDGAIISMPTYVYGIASEDYPQLGISDTLWTFIFEKFHTSDLVEGGAIAPSTVDKDYYWTHVNKAFDAINDEDIETMYAEADSMSNAFNDTRIWTVAYDDEAGYYFNTWIPAGLLTKMSGVTLSGQGSSPYMYGISGGTAELQEVLGDNGWGVYYEEDAEGFMNITSTGLELGKSFKRKFGTSSAAPTRMSGISAESVKNANKLFSGADYIILDKKFVNK